MKLRSIAAAYCYLVGISMFAVWGGFFATGTVFGIRPDGPGIGFHIAAELMTGIALLVAGVGLMRKQRWGLNTLFMGIGMLLYALVNSPGYYMKSGGAFILVVFGASAVVSLIVAVIGFMIES